MAAKTQPSSSSSPLLLIMSLLLLALSITVPSSVLSATLRSDIQALESIIRSIDPSSISPSSYLSTWDFSEDPCEGAGTFLGVMCSFPLENTTSRVTEIDLDDDGYDGFLSDATGNLTELTVLSLNKNRFRGPIPESVFQLRKLTKLFLSENFFTGDIPAEIMRLKELKTLDLSKNSIAGEIPPRISALRSLTHLILSNNHLDGRVPALNGLWKLQVLELGNNHLFGMLPKLPPSLRTLSICFNSLTGRISPLHRLKQLVSLDVSQNRFSGTIGHEILTFPEISRINVSFNQFISIEVIKVTGSRLRMLDAEGNHLQGHLPLNLATYENLKDINLRSNMFSGDIPRIYGKRLENSWRSLYLENNYLSGSLPEEFQRISKQIRGSPKSLFGPSTEPVHVPNTAMPQAGVSLTPELLATLASLLPTTSQPTGSESHQSIGLSNGEAPSQAWNRNQSTVADPSNLSFQQLGNQYNPVGQLPPPLPPPSVHYPLVSSTPNYSSGMQYQAPFVSTPQQAPLPTPPSNNYAMYSRGSHQAVSQPMRQQYQPEAPMLKQNYIPVPGTENPGLHGYQGYQQGNYHGLTNNQAHNANTSQSQTTMPPPANMMNLDRSSQVQQQLQPLLPEAEQGTSDGEVDKNQRYQSTLQFAANLLQQIQQQPSNASTGKGP